MILASYVFDTIQTLIRKDQKGNSFNIKEFNRIAKLVNYELYNIYASKINETQDITDTMRTFTTPFEPITLASGVGSLPAGYERMIGKPYYIDSGDYRVIDMVTELELADRQADGLTKPTATHPIGMIAVVPSVSDIIVYPITIAAIVISFLRLPVTPILDYYITAGGQYVYLDEGATAIDLPAGAVYSDGTPGPDTIATSLTIDFEWHEDQTPILIDMILQKAGVILEKQIPIEYGIAEQTKEEQND